MICTVVYSAPHVHYRTLSQDNLCAVFNYFESRESFAVFHYFETRKSMCCFPLLRAQIIHVLFSITLSPENPCAAFHYFESRKSMCCLSLHSVQKIHVLFSITLSPENPCAIFHYFEAGLVIRSFRSYQMSDCERFAQIAQEK